MVTDTKRPKRIRTSVRELVDGGLYPLSLRIVRECESQGLWPLLPVGGRLYARCLGTFLVVQALEESGSASAGAVAECTERLYQRAMGEVSAEVKAYARAEHERCVADFRSAFQQGGIDPLVEEFCRRTQCDDADAIKRLVDASAWLVHDAARYLAQYEAVLDPA